VCKHKLALLKGDVAMLFDPQQSPLLSEVHSLPQYGSLKNHIAEYETKLKELEVAKEVLAKKEKSIKSDFARGLAFGFK